MKIQLDTTNKTIKIEERVLISKLLTTLKGLLPNNEWKKYTLETHTVINNWNSPYIIKEIPVYPRPSFPVWPQYPWYTPYCSTTDKTSGIVGGIAMSKSSADYSIKSGVFNIEAKI